MTTIEIAFDSGSLLLLIQALFILFIAFLGWKLYQLPMQFADKFSRSIAYIAKEQPEGEAFLQLSEAITMAWKEKSWEPLIPLVANPIVQKAWINLRALLPKLGAVKEGETGAGSFAGD